MYDTEAYDWFLDLNPDPLEIGEEDDGAIYMVEEWWDADQEDARCYVLEYFASPDGGSAIAYCREAPWYIEGDLLEGHIGDDGQLCLGSETVTDVWSSPYDLEFVVLRSRYWCTAFSVYKETGHFPQPR